MRERETGVVMKPLSPFLWSVSVGHLTYLSVSHVPRYIVPGTLRWRWSSFGCFFSKAGPSRWNKIFGIISPQTTWQEIESPQMSRSFYLMGG